MNLHAAECKLLFELTHRSCRHRIRGDRKPGRLRNETRDLTEIFGVIGRDSHGPASSQGTMERGQKLSADQTARRMAALRPGIGKHKVKRRNGSLRQQPLDGVGNVELQDACIPKLVLFDFPARAAHSASETLNAEEISVEIFAGEGREKGTFTASEINFDGRMSAIDFVEIEGRETIGRDEFHLACYGCGMIGGQHVR